jgi:hypothetical protein
MTDAVTGYLNTLIFCIIAKALTLFLLVLLLFDIGWVFSYLILTIEIGLVMIIAWTLYKVYKFQKSIDALAAAAATAPPFVDTCPDYFVKTVSAETNDVVCQSKYDTTDKKNTYEFTGSGGTTGVPQQDMTQMTSSVKTFAAVCTAQQNNITDFSWTDLKGRCGFMDTYV